MYDVSLREEFDDTHVDQHDELIQFPRLYHRIKRDNEAYKLPVPPLWWYDPTVEPQGSMISHDISEKYLNRCKTQGIQLVGGASNTYWAELKSYSLRCAIFEKNLFPYATKGTVKHACFLTCRGILLWSRPNLNSFTDPKEPDTIYIAPLHQNNVSISKRICSIANAGNNITEMNRVGYPWLAMMRFTEGAIQLTEYCSV